MSSITDFSKEYQDCRATEVKSSVTIGDIIDCVGKHQSTPIKWINRIKCFVQSKGWISDENAKKLMERVNFQQLDRIQKLGEQVLSKMYPVDENKQSEWAEKARFKMTSPETEAKIKVMREEILQMHEIVKSSMEKKLAFLDKYHKATLSETDLHKEWKKNIEVLPKKFVNKNSEVVIPTFKKYVEFRLASGSLTENDLVKVEQELEILDNLAFVSVKTVQTLSQLDEFKKFIAKESKYDGQDLQKLNPLDIAELRKGFIHFLKDQITKSKNPQQAIENLHERLQKDSLSHKESVVVKEYIRGQPPTVTQKNEKSDSLNENTSDQSPMTKRKSLPRVSTEEAKTFDGRSTMPIKADIKGNKATFDLLRKISTVSADMLTDAFGTEFSEKWKYLRNTVAQNFYQPLPENEKYYNETIINYVTACFQDELHNLTVSWEDQLKRLPAQSLNLYAAVSDFFEKLWNRVYTQNIHKENWTPEMFEDIAGGYIQGKNEDPAFDFNIELPEIQKLVNEYNNGEWKEGEREVQIPRIFDIDAKGEVHTDEKTPALDAVHKTIEKLLKGPHSKGVIALRNYLEQLRLEYLKRAKTE